MIQKPTGWMNAYGSTALWRAARRQHLVEKVPCLLWQKEKSFLCDRFVEASLSLLVSQGAARRIGVTEIARLNEFAAEGTTPDFYPFILT